MTTALLERAAVALPAAPYRGIEPFRYVDKPIFFARDEETRKLLRYVAVYRGVLFYGDSGSGKSSLINAGFIPAIIEEGFTPDRLRVQPRPGEEIVVERISRSPDGGAPFLPSNFVGEDETTTRVVIAADALKDRLKALPEGRRPLLIFDQFEEFATLFETAPRGDAVRQAQEAQEAILRVVVELLRDASLPVKMLFVFREDYLAKLNKLVSLFPDLSDQYLRLTPPATSALSEIIRGSFEKFPGQFGKELPEDLTTRLAAAIEERSESRRLNLSEVQIACLELWKSDDPEQLFTRRGVQGLLEDYLSASLTRLHVNLRDPAVALLDRMVTPSGTRNIVSEYDLVAQVKDDERIPEERLKDALRALVEESRLVRRERRYDTYFYDIVSEFLVPWIMQQKSERLAQAERRKKFAAIGAAVLFLSIAAVVALGAWYVYARRTEAVLAQENVKQANAAQHQAENLRTKAESERIVAERDRDEALKRADTLTSAFASADRARADLEARLNDSNNRLDAATEENKKLNAKLDRYRGKDLSTIYQDALKERDMLEGQLNRAKVALNDCQDSLKKCDR